MDSWYQEAGILSLLLLSIFILDNHLKLQFYFKYLLGYILLLLRFSIFLFLLIFSSSRFSLPPYHIVTVNSLLQVTHCWRYHFPGATLLVLSINFSFFLFTTNIILFLFLHLPLTYFYYYRFVLLFSLNSFSIFTTCFTIYLLLLCCVWFI